MTLCGASIWDAKKSDVAIGSCASISVNEIAQCIVGTAYTVRNVFLQRISADMINNASETSRHKTAVV